MKQVTKNELIKAGAIYIENVLAGMDQYQYCSMKATYDQYATYLARLRNEHTLYVDFYYSRITDENRTLFEQQLEKEQMDLLDNLCKESEKCSKEEFIIFSPTEEQLLLLLEISFKELLFSTFYIVELPLTIWSNYDGEFVAFSNCADALEKLSLLTILG